MRHQLRAEATDALDRTCRRDGRAVSAAYADGFADGYVDQADNGGPPLPPAVPPPRYRRDAGDQTPAGQAAAREYLAGFRGGAELAVARNRRQGLLVPVAIPPTPPEPAVQVVWQPNLPAPAPPPPAKGPP